MVIYCECNEMNMDSGMLSGGPSSSSGQVDDSFEDVCSICLEPFSPVEPPSVTKCKHEYHLHCILEWSQRRNDCPICLQHLVLKDPASQELLAGADNDKNLRLRSKSNAVNQDNEINDDASHVDESDFEHKIMQHFATIANRARNISMRRRQATPQVGPSQIFPSAPITNTPNVTQVNSSSPEHQNPASSELVAFSESLKSKFSTASIKYKESISKSTRSLKEKLTAGNDSVKELSREVHREISASIAGIVDTVKTLRRE